MDVEIVPQGILCVASSSEGMVAPAENIQNFIAEHFNEMYLRSEELLQRNLIMKQRIGKLNSDIMRKLSGKRKEE